MVMRRWQRELRNEALQRGQDVQWVVYHGTAWDRLVEQGYITVRVEDRHGTQWAYMLKEVV